MMMKNLNNTCPKALKKFLEPFLDTLLFTKKFSNHTCQSYYLDIKQFYSFISSQQPQQGIDTVVLETAESYLSYLYQQKLSRKSIARKFSALRLFFDYLYLHNHIAKNPFQFIKIRGLRQDIPKTIPENNLKDFLDSLKAHDFISSRQLFCMECLYATGLRISEMLQLNIHDIQADGTCVIKGKGDKERLVWFSDKVREVLTHYISFRQAYDKYKEPALLISKKGLRLSARQLQREFASIRKVNDLPDWFTPHALRHAFASAVLNNGASLSVVQQLLGHQSIQSTTVYTHVNLEGIKQKMDSIDE